MQGGKIMEIHIIKDKTNPLLKRRELSLKIQNKGTPSRIEVKNKIAALANSRPELIVIEHLETVFGKQEVVGSASIYETEGQLKRLAHQHLAARDARDAPKATEAKEPEAKVEAEVKKEPETK
jgi:small subunit ribosomal protein S24e